MKKLIALSLSLVLTPLTALAQDDMYFVPTKDNVKKSAETYGMPRQTYYSGSNRSVDEYNRRMQSTVEQLDSVNNDIISFDAVAGEYPDSVANDDFECTRRMSRFDDYNCNDAYWSGYYAGRAGRWSWGWYDPWYYGSYYGWYDPWYYGRYYGWYDPWYYSWGYYRPWYYGGWGWHYPHYVGGGHVAHRGNAGWGNRHSNTGFAGRKSSTQDNSRFSSRNNNTRTWNNGNSNIQRFNNGNSSFGTNRSSFGGSRSGGFSGGSRGGGFGGGGSRGGGFGGRR